MDREGVGVSCQKMQSENEQLRLVAGNQWQHCIFEFAPGVRQELHVRFIIVVRQAASQPASKKTSWARRSLLDRDYPKLCTFEPRLLYVLLAVLFGFFLLLFMTAIYSLVFHTPKFLWKRDEMTRRGGRIDTHNSMWQWLHSLRLRHLIDFGAPIHPQVYNNSRQTVQIGPQTKPR